MALASFTKRRDPPRTVFGSQRHVTRAQPEVKEKALQPAAPAQKALDAERQEALGIVRRVGTATEAATEPAGATVPPAAAAARIGTVGPQPPAMPRRKVRNGRRGMAGF